MALVPVTVWLLCGIGVYASARMTRYAWLDRHEALSEPSIVRRPTARLYFGIPNPLLGLLYYPFVAAAFAFGANPVVRLAVTVAVAAAALTSLYLMYDLAFVSRRTCLNCWAANAVNLALAAFVAGRWTHA